MKVERLVVDSNVLISAALSAQGAPALLLDHLTAARSVLVFSAATMTELTNRLLQAKFDRYVDRDMRLRFLAEIDAVAEFVGISGSPMGCRNRADDMFLETALNGECKLIVSGDQDLLALHPWRDIRIVGPADALEVVFAGG